MPPARVPNPEPTVTAMALLVPVSWGELLDKITILEIKQDRIADPEKVANVGRELAALRSVADGTERPPAASDLVAQLRAVNEHLWDIEDSIRDCERRQDFGADFVDLARAVYHTNDRRAEIKRDLNLMLGSELVEEKSYAEYRHVGPA